MKKDIKQKIIETSYNLFREYGYEQVTVQSICKKCDITKPTFYRYFKSKDELLSYFYDQLTAELPDRLLEMIVAENYWEQIKEGFRAILSWSLTFGVDLYSNLFISNLRENKGTFDFNDKLTETMVVLYERAQKSGQVRNPSPARELYIASASMSFGYGVIWCLNGGKTDLLDDFTVALESVLDVAPDFRKNRTAT